MIFSCEASGSSPVNKIDQPDAKVQSPQVGAANMDQYLQLLEGKKVGVVGNQSSLINGVHLVDTLLSRGIDLVSVFSPEHGFRGDADAGEHVASQKDEKTGISIVSLYGSNKKPKAEQIKGLDVLVFDIQDVGVRFYTYISTLHYVMEACAENNVALIILDRPNPNGHYVDGPVLELKYKSFVGMHKVPIVHGMTIGEYGSMINGEKWLKGDVVCDLTVIKCNYYNHSTPWRLEVPPSPNLRSDLSISLYPSLCLLEATTVTVGRGTDYPFEQYGHPDFHDSLQYMFMPEPNFGSKKPKHEGKDCHGFILDDPKYNRMNQLDLSFLIQANELLKGDMFGNKSKRMFYLLCGNAKLLTQVKQGMSEEDIRATWQEDLDEFKLIREKYVLYN